MGLELEEDATEYGAAFFTGIAEGSRRSADDVVGLILGIFSPRSIVDVGGGGGHWAAACLAQGVSDLLTIDGPWVPQAARVVPSDRFQEHDLAHPLVLDRTFDLALCLEAAEHLPASAAADLVRSLTKAAPVIIFSAALPGQGGDGHINEQLPSYWATLFAAQGYTCFPDLRRRIWKNPAIEVWYRQNLLCFVRNSEVHRWRDALADPLEAGDPLLDVAHPDLLVRHKLRADRLEAYAQRLEREAVQASQDIAQLRLELTRARAEITGVPRRLRLAANFVRRAWRRVSGPLGLRRAR